MGHNRAWLSVHVRATFVQYQVIFFRFCKIFSMDILELCGYIFNPGGQLETPGLVLSRDSLVRGMMNTESGFGHSFFPLFSFFHTQVIQTSQFHHFNPLPFLGYTQFITPFGSRAGVIPAPRGLPFFGVPPHL